MNRFCAFYHDMFTNLHWLDLSSNHPTGAIHQVPRTIYTSFLNSNIYSNDLEGSVPTTSHLDKFQGGLIAVKSETSRGLLQDKLSKFALTYITKVNYN
jgi:hypothetical protein